MMINKNLKINKFTTTNNNKYFAIALSQVFSYNIYYIQNKFSNEKYYFCINDNNKYINSNGIYDDINTMLKLISVSATDFSQNPVKVTKSFYKKNADTNAQLLENTRNYIYKNIIKYTDDKNIKFYSKNVPLDDKTFSNRKCVQRKLYFNKDKVITAIDIDEIHEEIKIKNFTNDIFLRAFGIDEHPTWAKYQDFLKDRCIPKTRYGIKNYLRDMGVDVYDADEIIKKTHAKVTDDKEWLISEKEITL